MTLDLNWGLIHCVKPILTFVRKALEEWISFQILRMVAGVT